MGVNEPAITSITDRMEPTSGTDASKKEETKPDEVKPASGTGSESKQPAQEPEEYPDPDDDLDDLDGTAYFAPSGILTRL